MKKQEWIETKKEFELENDQEIPKKVTKELKQSFFNKNKEALEFVFKCVGLIAIIVTLMQYFDSEKAKINSAKEKIEADKKDNERYRKQLEYQNTIMKLGFDQLAESTKYHDTLIKSELERLNIQNDFQVREQRALFEVNIFDKAISNISDIINYPVGDVRFAESKKEFLNQTIPKIGLLGNNLLDEKLRKFEYALEMYIRASDILDSIWLTALYITNSYSFINSKCFKCDTFFQDYNSDAEDYYVRNYDLDSVILSDTSIVINTLQLGSIVDYIENTMLSISRLQKNTERMFLPNLPIPIGISKENDETNREIIRRNNSDFGVTTIGYINDLGSLIFLHNKTKNTQNNYYMYSKNIYDDNKNLKYGTNFSNIKDFITTEWHKELFGNSGLFGEKKHVGYVYNIKYAKDNYLAIIKSTKGEISQIMKDSNALLLKR
jgi:hypothetical protein